MTVSAYTPSGNGTIASNNATNGTRFYLIGGCQQDQVLYACVRQDVSDCRKDAFNICVMEFV